MAQTADVTGPLHNPLLRHLPYASDLVTGQCLRDGERDGRRQTGSCMDLASLIGEDRCTEEDTRARQKAPIT